MSYTVWMTGDVREKNWSGAQKHLIKRKKAWVTSTGEGRNKVSMSVRSRNNFMAYSTKCHCVKWRSWPAGPRHLARIFPAFLDNSLQECVCVSVCAFFLLSSFKYDDALSVSISSDHHINSLQGDVACCKHHPLQDWWHHRLSRLSSVSSSARTWVKPSRLNNHFAKAISQQRMNIPRRQ